MLFLIFTGRIRNPLVFILLIASLPMVMRGLRKGSEDEGQDAVTPDQRWKMGVSYIGLCAVLAWLMGESHLML